MQRPDTPVHPEAAVAPGYLVNHAARVFNRLVDAMLRPHELSMALLGPLLLLSWKGPMSQRDLVRFSAVKQPAMVALLDKLETAGAIVRSPAPTDRRSATVSLTEKGQAMADRGGQTLRDANTVGMEGLSAEEVSKLVGLLGRLSHNLEQYDRKEYHA